VSATSDIGSQDYYVNAVSVRQALTPDRLRGRVNATMRFIAGGMQPIGARIGGALGTILGLPATLGVAAFGMLLAVLWLYLHAKVAPARLLAGERVQAHQLAELQEVGHAAGALQLLVQLAPAAGNGHVFPRTLRGARRSRRGPWSVPGGSARSRTRPNRVSSRMAPDAYLQKMGSCLAL